MNIVNDTKSQIFKGDLKPGDKIKSENELSVEYGLSRQTVRHSISVLEQEGLVRKVKGSGTYITDNAVTDRTNRKTIAVITTYVDAYIFPQMIQYVERVISDAGYDVRICFTDNRISRERTILEGIIEKDDVAGIIAEAIKSNLPNPNIKYYEKLKAMRIPILFLNSFYENINIPHVSINDVQAGKLATEYVIEKGHTKIGGVFKLDDGQGAKRYYGFLESMNKAGLEVTGNDILWFDTVDLENEKSIENLFNRIKARLGTKTALVFYSDEVALKLSDLFFKNGIKIPDDVSIVGIGDSILSADQKIRLTTVKFPIRSIAEKVATNMIEMINNLNYNGTYEFDLELMEKDSVKNMNSEM